MRPPFRLSAPVPSAAALPRKRRPPLTDVAPEVVFAPESVSEPALRIVPPVKLFAPDNVRAPGPVLVNAPAPEIMPPMVSAPVVWAFMPTWTVRLAASPTAPVPVLSEFVPMKVKSLPMVIPPVEVSVVPAPSRPTA